MNDNLKLVIDGYNAEKLAIQSQILLNDINGDSNIFNNARLREIDKVIKELLAPQLTSN